MSWNAIRSALQTRLLAIDGIENVHNRMRFDESGFNSPRFRTLFCSDGTQDLVNNWMITRTGFVDALCDDSDSVYKRTHSVQIVGFHPIEDDDDSEGAFNDLADAIADDLKDGDRTLGGACYTHGLANVTPIQNEDFYQSIFGHGATIAFEVEEHV